MQRIIGIDFGTSTTYMNIKRYNGAQPDGDKFSYIPVMFNYGESSGYVATIVRENADGSFDFGEKASEPLEGSKIHTEIKMRLESSDEQERAEARRITREFFKFLHAQYAQQTANLGGAGDQEETVVSYPVKWKKETAQFMLDAARDAGFQNVRGMDEAEAAVATVLCQNSGGTGLIYADKPGYLMLIDMGAGTTDLVVCRYQASADGQIAIELVTSWPHSAEEPTFGGREIDKVLEQYVEDHLTKSLLPALAPQASVIARAPGQAKMWKERNVSVTLAADKQVNTCAYIGTYKTMGMLTGDFPAFGRREFESFAESGLRDYARLISGCLEKTAEADENFSALDLVILTGGHSAWYFAKEILTGAMEGWLDHQMLVAVREDPCRVVNLPNPQTTVSLGLVYSKLPFRLEKKPAQKSGQDFNQTRSIEIPQQKTANQLPVEDKKSADTMEDAEAFYTQAARTFFAEKICDLRAVYFAISRLNIPSGEELFWAEGIVKGAADPGTYAVTECGVYLQGAFGGKHCLSWEEFVSAEWAGKAFAAPSWQNGDNWDTSVPLVVKQEKGPLKELHTYLRALNVSPEKKASNTMPKGQLAQSATQYIWDDRFLSIVKQFIQEDPVIRSRNQIHKYPDHKKLWYSVERKSVDHEIYCVIEPGGNDKHIICSDGLYVNYYQGYFMGYSNGPNLGIVSWDVFLNGYLDDPNSFEGKIVQERFGLGGSLCRLQALLREEASKESKEKSKQSTTQTFQTVETESFDAAMKRFNRQVKDAKQQQKVSAKPTQPVQADAQPSGKKYYKWDDRLLPIVKEYIQTCPEIARWNQVDNSTVRNGILRDFFENYTRDYRPLVEKNIYYMRSKGWDSRNRFKIADVICSLGLYSGDFEKSLFKRDCYYRYMSWEEFLNIEGSWTEGKPVWYKSCYLHSYTHFDFFFQGDGMQRLLILLRKKSIALEEGRPI